MNSSKALAREIAQRTKALEKLWQMNPHLAPEFEQTFEGLRYWHKRERLEVYESEEER